jgi:hypothetical protein
VLRGCDLHRNIFSWRDTHWYVLNNPKSDIHISKVLIGDKTFPAGRHDDAPSPPSGLSTSLSLAGFKLGRLKTGTPARLDKCTIDFSRLERQDGDVPASGFAFWGPGVKHEVSVRRGRVQKFRAFANSVARVGRTGCMLQDDYDGRNAQDYQGEYASHNTHAGNC